MMKIKELILYTSQLTKQLKFYSKLLELKILAESTKQFSLKIGTSILTFKYKKNTSPYHFAFNIPIDKEEEALEWLKERVNILPYTGDEIADFKSWNAKAIYFYDIDDNIVEFISRRKLNVFDKHKFSSRSILHISEIGLPTFEMNRSFHELNQLHKIDTYGKPSKSFCALGNEEGMFIMVNPALKKWFPTDDKIYQSDFIVQGDFNFKFTDGKINKLS